MTAKSSVHNLNLAGHYSWELLFDIDNSDNSGTVRRLVEIKSSVFCSYHSLRKEIQSSDAATSMGLNVGGVFDVISIGVKGEMSFQVKSMYESMSETHSELKTETTKTDTYEVGPHSRLKMYRLVFNGPGINYITDTVSSTPHDMKDVQIDLTLRQASFLQDIDVVYTNDSVSRPSNLISEVNGKNPDINAGYGGEFVWLVARWTTKLDDAASGIQIVVQDNGNNNYMDLAKGAGGAFRYIKMRRDPYSKNKIIKIALYRTPEAEDNPCDGRWQFKTGDINWNRGKDYLYLVWNEASI
ncbi:unnamed protein product [Orchesella dallaii]|uniref:Uncharacterized protein n=1 Tax=Orchesella dallaii TaxID=48710 RepID=A0ABP1RF75_9HEXA